MGTANDSNFSGDSALPKSSFKRELSEDDVENTKTEVSEPLAKKVPYLQQPEKEEKPNISRLFETSAFKTCDGYSEPAFDDSLVLLDSCKYPTS